LLIKIKINLPEQSKNSTAGIRPLENVPYLLRLIPVLLILAMINNALCWEKTFKPVESSIFIKKKI
jgi:hypothetical protein